MGVTQGRLFIVSLNNPNDRLELQYVPKSIPMRRSANIAEIEIVGRNNPIHLYASGKNEFKLVLDFSAEEENHEDVIRKVKWLESLAMNDGYAKPPIRIKLVYGKLFRNEIWIVQDVDSDLSLFQKNKGYLPKQGYVTLTLKQDISRNTRVSDVRWS